MSAQFLDRFLCQLAIDVVARGHEHELAATGVRPRSSGDRVVVLIGVDGSGESHAAAEAAVALLRERIGNLTLATVIDYDAGMARREGARGDAEAILANAATAIGVRCNRRVLVGAAADALATAAHDGRFDVLVVGSRGQGASRALVGSVASKPAHRVGLPVLIGGVQSSASGARRFAAPRSGSEDQP